MKQVPQAVFVLQREIKKRLQSNGHYLLAVSGGADSLALAHACSVLAASGRGRYSVCHVEHGLRGDEALHDLQLVQNFCRQYDLPFYAEHVQAADIARKQHLSTEDAARRLRYAVLRRYKTQLGADAIVTAHHLGDQAETVLLKLLRGAGLDGLSGMRAQADDIIRPLLALPKSLLEEYCRLCNIRYAYDSTNADTAYTRNRVRLELLPYLERNFNSAIIPTLARTAELLAQDADCLEQLAAQSYGQLVQEQAAGISIPIEPLLQLAPALRVRVLRRAYFALGGAELSYERTQALEALCRRRAGGKCVQLPDKITACLKNKLLIFVKSL